MATVDKRFGNAVHNRGATMRFRWRPYVPMLALILLGGCARQVSFNRDVFPILQSRCISCHRPGGAGYAASHFSVESYETFMRGTRFGPVINPGSSVDSTLVLLIEHKADPSINMPHNQEPLSERQVKTIKRWIDQGAKNN